MPTATPTLDVEASFAERGVRYLGAVDEVGRGAIAGVASVGLVVVDLENLTDLPGVADSKLLSAARRQELVPRIREWAVDASVGHASPDEVEQHGIVIALRLAGMRALNELACVPDLILLDGSHDWLTPPVQASLFDTEAAPLIPPVVTRVKADRDCLSVAAASVLAKVARDEIMTQLDRTHPGYGFAANAGYGTAEHLAACRRLGVTGVHRRSWVKGL